MILIVSFSNDVYMHTNNVSLSTRPSKTKFGHSEACCLDHDQRLQECREVIFAPSAGRKTNRVVA